MCHRELHRGTRLTAPQFGVMAVTRRAASSTSLEKPADRRRCRPSGRGACQHGHLRSTRYLYAELERDIADAHRAHDFGKDIIPTAVAQWASRGATVQCGLRAREEDEEPYWRDVGTIDAYWEANIDLTATKPLLNLYDTGLADLDLAGTIAGPPSSFTTNRPARGCDLKSTVSGGCIISAHCSDRCCFQLPGAFVLAGNWSCCYRGRSRQASAPEQGGGRSWLRPA